MECNFRAVNRLLIHWTHTKTGRTVFIHIFKELGKDLNATAQSFCVGYFSFSLSRKSCGIGSAIMISRA
jgi:hypothetical protein